MEHILPKKTLERLEVIQVDAPAEVLLAMKQDPKLNQNKNMQMAMNFGMGFVMGFMIGTIMPSIHLMTTNRAGLAGLKGKGKMIIGAGTAFGSIFGFGSLVRQ